MFSKNLRREAESYHEYYSASGDFIFWQALRVAFERAVEDDRPDGQDFQYRTVGGPRGLLSNDGVQKFADWLDDENKVRDDTAILAKFVVNFRDSVSESLTEQKKERLQYKVNYGNDMRRFMRENEMGDVLKTRAREGLKEVLVPERMLYPFGMMTIKNPLPSHLWERVRDVSGGYVDDFKGKTCEEQKKICDDVAKQSDIAKAFSCAHDPLKSAHEDTCGRDFLYTLANRDAALTEMTGEIRMMFTRNVTYLNLDEVQLKKTDDPLFKLKLPKLRTLRVHGEPPSPQRQIGEFDIDIYAMRRNMPNLESLFVEGLKIYGEFNPSEHDWPPKLRAVELIRTGLKQIELRSEVLRSVDISGNVLKHPLVLGKNIETLKLRNMGLRHVPPAVFGLAALTHLDMGKNYLTTIPYEIFDLTNLRRLVLDGNRIAGIPPHIEKLVKLETLNLADNDTEMILSNIPYTFESLNNLKTLNLGPHVNREDADGKTPLHNAALNDNEGIVKVLLKAGTDVDRTDRKGWTPLLFAASHGHEGVVKALLNAGADANRADHHHETPLLLAAYNGHEAAVRALLAAGANANHEDKDGWTPLLLAARYGHEGVVSALLGAGANVNKVDVDGATPLLLAAELCHEAVVRALLNAKPDVNKPDKEGWTPLLVAANEAVVSALLAAGADVNHANNDDVTEAVREMIKNMGGVRRSARLSKNRTSG